MLQNHSAVHTGNQNCSFHGTTVQLVQPNPSLATSQINATISSRPSTDTTLYSSTRKGPKKPRTVECQQLTPTNLAATPFATSPYQQLQYDNFIMSYSEKKILDDLAHKLFKYLFIKISCASDEVILNDMRLFLHQSNQCTVTPTKIHYLELCNENPDSEETMLHVTENLMEIVKKRTARVVAISWGW